MGPSASRGIAAAKCWPFGRFTVCHSGCNRPGKESSGRPETVWRRIPFRELRLTATPGSYTNQPNPTCWTAWWDPAPAGESTLRMLVIRQLRCLPQWLQSAWQGKLRTARDRMTPNPFSRAPPDGSYTNQPNPSCWAAWWDPAPAGESTLRMLVIRQLRCLA